MYSFGYPQIPLLWLARAEATSAVFQNRVGLWDGEIQALAQTPDGSLTSRWGADPLENEKRGLTRMALPLVSTGLRGIKALSGTVFGSSSGPSG